MGFESQIVCFFEPRASDTAPRAHPAGNRRRLLHVRVAGMTTPRVQEVMPKAIFEDVTRNLSLSQLFESAFGAKEAAARRTAGSATADNVGSLPFEAAVRQEHVRVAA